MRLSTNSCDNNKENYMDQTRTQVDDNIDTPLWVPFALISIVIPLGIGLGVAVNKVVKWLSGTPLVQGY